MTKHKDSKHDVYQHIRMRICIYMHAHAYMYIYTGARDTT